MKLFSGSVISLLATALPAQQDYTPFGTGCVGSVGVPVLSAAPGPLPRVDGVFTMQLSNLPAGNLGALVALGFSDSRWAGISLPLDLSSVGMWGCTVYVSVDAALPVDTTGGTAQLPVTIPNDPSLLALSFFTQAVVLDPTVNAFGGVMSNAAEGIIGPRAAMPPTHDMSGSWQIVETSRANNCGDPTGIVDRYRLTATANGNNLTVAFRGTMANWTVTGTTILLTGSFRGREGIITIESTSSLTAADADNFSGTMDWSWINGAFTCSGTSSIVASRQ